MAEEKRESGSTPAVQEAAAGAADKLARAAQQSLQYPEGHPVSDAAFDRARQAVARLLGMRDPILLVADPQGLQLPDIGAVTSSAAVGLSRDMRARGVGGLRVTSGVTAAELRVFIALLGTDPSEIERAGGPAKWLSRAAPEHLQIREVDFSGWVRASAATPGTTGDPTQTAQADAALHSFFSGTAELLPEDAFHRLVEILDKPEEAVDWLTHEWPTSSVLRPEVAGPGGSDSARGAVQADGELAARAEVLPETEDRPAAAVAGALQRIYQALQERTPQELDARLTRLADVVRTMQPQTRSRVYRAPLLLEDNEPDVLAEIGALFSNEQCAETVVPDARALLAETSAQLERLLRRLAGGNRRPEDFLAAVQDRLRSLGIPSELYNNTINLLLGKDFTRQSFLQAIEDGTMPVPESPTAPTLDEAETARQREVVADALRPSDTTRSRALTLGEVLLNEQDSAAYSRVASAAESLVPHLAEAGSFSASARLLSALEKHASDTTSALSWRRLRAEQVLANVRSDALISHAQALFEAAGDQASGELVEWLTALGPSNARAFGRALLDQRFAHLRDALLASLVGWGENADAAIAETLPDLDSQQVTTLIRLLAEAGDKRASRHVRNWLRGNDPRLASQALDVLATVRDRESTRMLVETVERGDRELRVRAIDTLAAAREESAVPALADVAMARTCSTNDTALRTHAVRALAAIPTAGAERTLEEILGKRSFIFSGRIEPLRIEVARALGEMATPAAKKALEECRRHSRGPLRQACEEALTRSGQR